LEAVDSEEDGQTVLHVAAAAGALLPMRALLAAGAEAAARDSERSTPLLLEAYKGHAAAVELLLAAPGCDGGHERDARGLSALHLSSFAGAERLMRLLLGRGHDVTAVDKKGKRLLHLAAKRGHAGTA